MSIHQAEDRKKVTALTLRRLKIEAKPVVMLTAYDYTMARLVDEGGVDMILVGDSAANVMSGYSTTLPITLDEMIYHARSVVRATRFAMVVVDMPFGSYQVSEVEAMTAAVRIMKESGADAIKIEGGDAYTVGIIRRIVSAGIPVVGHLGLTPQSVHQLGGYGLQAKDEAAAELLYEQSLALDEAGCCALVLEKIPAMLARRVSEQIHCPTIGIGAGVGTDGQVLVLQDMLGLNDGFAPKFLRRFARLAEVVRGAVGEYATAVRERSFPSDAESY